MGVTVAGLTVVYGFARPFIYNRSPKIAAVLNNAKPKIVFTPDSHGNRNIGFQIAYTIKF
jgi:hypothetical protein